MLLLAKRRYPALPAALDFLLQTVSVFPETQDRKLPLYPRASRWSERQSSNHSSSSNLECDPAAVVSVAEDLPLAWARSVQNCRRAPQQRRERQVLQERAGLPAQPAN